MSTKPIVFRVSQIPGGDAVSRETELRELIGKSLSETEKKDVMSAIKISIVPSCKDPQTLTALVEFKNGLPEFLKALQQNPLRTHQLVMGEDDVEFDLHFHGLTQLYKPAVNSSEITADVVAITGLDGHAYGSCQQLPGRTTMSTKPIVFRVSQIPGGDAVSRETELRKLIGESLSETEKKHVMSGIKISIVPSCKDPQTLTALVDFKSGLPEFLEPLQQDPLPLRTYQLEMGDNDIEFDLHFHGLTQLYNPAVDPSEITADVVAITGLDGHAYGSWRGGNLGRMWLRDFLSKDLPNCRVMIYGYNAKLSTPGLHTIAHFGAGLREELRKARRSDQERRRPIIFVTHSFGGIILIDCLIEAAFTGTDREMIDLANATYGFMFFGTPHRGLAIEDMKSMIEKNNSQSRNDLLSDINTGSRLLEQQLMRFKNWIGDRKVVSFIETLQTKRLQLQTDGTWARTGEYTTTVSRDSALMHLPDNVEEKITVEGDHSTMVKFGSKNNPAYESALERLQRFEEDAKAVVEKRFRSFADRTESRVHFMVSYPRNERYIGRDPKVGRITEKLAQQKNSGHRRLAMYGLGGVGKTQDVLEYVYTFKDSRVSVFWVHAGSTARFEQDYRKLAELVQLPGWDDPKKDVRPFVKNWFEGPKSGDWILVLDNADNKLDFFAKGTAATDAITASGGLAQFIPQGAKGTVIVTTRDREVADQLADMNIVSKETMDTEEAKQLFTKHFPGSTDHEDETIFRLLSALQYLPLAIVQVAAYLRVNPQFSLAEYIELFNSTRDNQKRLLSKTFRDLRRQASDETVLTTFSITFRQVQEQSPLSGSLLKLIACIDRQTIPHELLVGSGLEGADDKITFDEAISKLLNFSLLTTVEHRSAYEMHALVHVSVKAFLTLQEMETVLKLTAKAFAGVLPDGEFRNWSLWRIYLPHASTFVTNIMSESEHTAAIYFLMSWYLESVGRYPEAEDLARRSVKVRAALLGQEHPDTLASMANLALTCRNQGQWKEAEELEVKVLTTSSRVLGQEHPHTLTSMANLASTFRNQGRWKAAEELEVKVLTTSSRVLGQEHPHTLTSMANLASTFWNQGRWKEAERQGVKVVETTKRVLGQEHPHTLTSMANLASTFLKQGRWKEAEELEVKVMEIRLRVLGQEHPSTLTSMANLASTFRDQGRWKEAEELEVKVMEIRLRVLGQKHPDTLTGMANLAYTWKSQGRIAEAIVMMTDAADIRSRLIGSDHPDTRDSISTLKTWRDEVGKQRSTDILWDVIKELVAGVQRTIFLLRTAATSI